MKKLFLAVAVATVAAALVLLPIFPDKTEASLNRTLRLPPYRASDQARKLHQRLAIVDLHADTLLWARDPLERATRGHVDVPRLIEGNVALQAFTAVTKVPERMNIERNEDTSDAVTPLVIAQRWPLKTWKSLTQRAMYQAHRLNDAAGRSQGKLSVIRTGTDLREYLTRRLETPAITAGFLGIEGAHALEGDLNRLDLLFDAGFRMMSLTHFTDIFVSGSSSGIARGGLSEQGRVLVRRMEQRGMIIDLAHASPATIDDVLTIAAKPLVVSHTGVTGTCANQRNLTDDQIRRIAARRGVIGIGYFYTATCVQGADAVVRAIRHVADLVGPEHVALGSDFDGGTAAPFDTTGLVLITDALLSGGFSEKEIRMIMGGNVIELLLRTLPE